LTKVQARKVRAARTEMQLNTNTRPKLFLPLALLNPAPAAARSHSGVQHGGLSPLELRRIVADLIG